MAACTLPLLCGLVMLRLPEISAFLEASMYVQTYLDLSYCDFCVFCVFVPCFRCGVGLNVLQYK